MNQLVISTIFALFILQSATAVVYGAEPEKKEAAKTKLVCKPVKGKDGKVVKDKNGNDRQSCKTIKVHKKYEGTKANTKEKK